MLGQESQYQRFCTVQFHLYVSQEKAKIQKQKTDWQLPEVLGWGRFALYPICGADYKNLGMCKNS